MNRFMDHAVVSRVDERMSGRRGCVAAACHKHPHARCRTVASYVALIVASSEWHHHSDIISAASDQPSEEAGASAHAAARARFLTLVRVRVRVRVGVGSGFG